MPIQEQEDLDSDVMAERTRTLVGIDNTTGFGAHLTSLFNPEPTARVMSIDDLIPNPVHSAETQRKYWARSSPWSAAA
ncbi:MAG: hypothetical protein JWM11_1288 [Planctomycetaceae bacterium]|nr:hypothetical protein [Planctomycetaceae bacterium]